jgi:PAS domain S-box-containing protein
MPRLLRTSPVLRYAGALGCSAGSVLLWWVLAADFGRRLGFAVVYPLMVVATRFFGIGPGILTAIAGGAGVIVASRSHDPFLWGVYAALSILAIYVTGAWGRARDHATHLSDDEATSRAREEHLSAQLRAIVESSADAVISKDLDGRIQSWNRAAEEIFGYTAAEVVGRSGMLVPRDRPDEEAEIAAQILRGGSMKQFETERMRKDGRRIQVSLTVSPIRGSSGEIVGISQIARDISEKKVFEEQLRQAQKLESLGVLAGGVAHDFNNLLTDIMGNAGLVLEELPAGSKVRERVGEVVQASERAAVLVRQMLAYAGKGQFVIEKLDLSAQVAEITPLLQGSLPRNVEFRSQLEVNLPAVEADRSQIQQLILNLGQNAAESIESDRGVVTFATSHRQNGDRWEVLLQVTDTGCGISEADRERIFDPFFTTKFTGRGLGLAAVMGIIRAHHGSIAVDSIPGRGSKFTVVLPAAGAVGKANSAAAERRESGQRAIS